MEDGEYRASFGKTWVVILPPLILLALLAPSLRQPFPQGASPVAVAMTWFGLALCVGLPILGFRVLAADRLVLTTQELHVVQTASNSFRASWTDIASVTMATPSGQSLAYTLTLTLRDGTKRRISTAFFPVSGPGLRDEILRRAGV